MASFFGNQHAVAPLALKKVFSPSRLDAVRQSRVKFGISMKTGKAERTFGDLFDAFTVGRPGFAESRVQHPILGRLFHKRQERFYQIKACRSQDLDQLSIRFSYLRVTEARAGRQIV